MVRCACILAALVVAGSYAPASVQDKTPATSRKLPAGVYAVLRASLKKKEVLPLKDGEVLVVHHHRYQKKRDKETPEFLVVRSGPDVALDLVGKPKAVKQGQEVVTIFLKLQPKAAAALKRLTSERPGKRVAIILNGEVVTTHKVREVIKGGEVKISACVAGAANYLLEQLQAHQAKKSTR
jgi:preprotein translocase subunit SecD